MDWKLKIAALLGAVAYWYSARNHLGSIEEQTIEGWRRQLGPPAKQYERVAVGLNANLDLIVSGTALLRALKQAAGKADDHLSLGTVEDVQETFAYFHGRGSAAERVMTSAAVFKEIVQTADKLDKKKYFVGGNAALMAQTMVESSPNSKVMLVGPVGKKLRGFLDKNVNVPASSLQEEDEVHLIMEYSRGEKWGENAASCANRFIFSHDVANSELQPLAHFAESLQSFNPDLVVVSGLHLLDNKPASFWQPRVDKLKSSLKRLPANTPVHLELASIANLEFVAGLAKSIFQSVHSIGLNEQELMAVSRAAGGPHTSVSAKGPPQAGVVADVLAWLLTKFGGGQSTLSRVHFHSLTFHVTSQVKGRWQNSETATGSAARVAGRRACQQNEIQPESVDLLFPLSFSRSVQDATLRQEPVVYNASAPVSSWQRDGLEFFLSPVLVCKHPQKTVGLGDAISATGLLYSKYTPAS